MADNKLDIVARCDLMSSLQCLVDTGQVDTHGIMCLDKFMSGLSIQELTFLYPNARELLISVLALLEYTSGYTDESFLSSVLNKYPKFKTNIPVHRNDLHMYGRTFT